MSVRHKLSLASASFVALVGTSAPAGAQQQPPNASQPTEIVVTANKREQNLRDVDSSVDVLQKGQLQARQITTLADVASMVPGLSFANSAENTPVYTLRGVGFYDDSLGGYPAVSVNLDEVPLPFPALASHSAYDLDRVEVLKGPQGTLYGENATGGAINFIESKPTNHFVAGGDVSYGNYNAVNSDLYVGGPLTDTLRGRVALRTEDADGWQHSNSRPGDRNGSVDNVMGRILLDYDPAPFAHFELNVNGWRDRSQPQAAQYIAFNPSTPGTTPALTQNEHDFSPQNAQAADWKHGLPFADNTFWQTSLRGDIDLGHTLTLTSISSYIHFKQDEGVDQDGLPIAEADHTPEHGSVRSLYQEVRLGDGKSNALRWLVGGNYEHSIVDQTIHTSFADASSAGLLGIQEDTYGALQRDINWSAFGNAEYDLLPTVTVKGGVRYTSTQDHATSCITDLDAPYNTGNFFYQGILGGAFGQYPPGHCIAINNQGKTIGGVAPFAPGAYDATLTEHNISWKAAVDWKPWKDSLFYVSISKGYKAGSFPTATGSVFTSYLPVKQEALLAYEVGLKQSFFERRVDVTAAGFYYDYDNKQLRAKVVAAPFGILDVLQNIPKSSIKGGEIQINTHPIRGLTVGVAFTYLDGTIDQFSGINGAGIAGNFAGAAMPFTPKYEESINVDYTHPLRGGMQGFIGGSLGSRTGTVAIVGGDQVLPTVTPAGSTPFRIDGYTTLDLRAGVSWDDDRYKLSVYGKNVTNTYYWNNVYSTTDTIERMAAMPATYGVVLAFRY